MSAEGTQLLEDIEGHAKLLMSCEGSGPLLWPRPGSQEQEEWLHLCPAGGTLQHTQVCIIAQGSSSEEWFPGQLFVSEAGIAVRAAHAEIFVYEQTETVFFEWSSIELLIVDKAEIKVSSPNRRVLRLLLGSQQCDRLKTAWSKNREDSCQFHSFASALDVQENKSIPRKMSFDEYPADEPITQTFLVACNDLPTDTAFKETKPLCYACIPNVSLQHVRKVLEKDDDWFFCRFQTDVLKAWDLVVTPWVPAQLTPGTKVRKVASKLVPEDVPKAVKWLFPDILEPTVLAQLHSTESQLTLVMQTCILNVPYSDCQRLEDTILFEEDGNGGVKVTKWMKMVWIKSTPWFLNMAKSFMEMRTKQEGLAAWEQYVEVLKQACKQSCE